MTGNTETERGLVLIVEDDEDSRYVYKAILEDNGFEVTTATSGDDGLRLAQQQHPQVILMDVSIPGMDGWSVTSRLKADPATAGIPLIIITAHAFPEDLRRAEKVGCDAFLTKPCEPRHVLQEVLRMLEGVGERRPGSSGNGQERRDSDQGEANAR